jgi:hypothetical protein
MPSKEGAAWLSFNKLNIENAVAAPAVRLMNDLLSVFMIFQI